MPIDYPFSSHKRPACHNPPFTFFISRPFIWISAVKSYYVERKPPRWLAGQRRALRTCRFFFFVFFFSWHVAPWAATRLEPQAEVVFFMQGFKSDTDYSFSLLKSHYDSSLKVFASFITGLWGRSSGMQTRGSNTGQDVKHLQYKAGEWGGFSLYFKWRTGLLIELWSE